MLKPAYSFGGIPIIQKAKPYVDNYLSMRQNVQDYSKSLSIYALKTNLEALLGGNANDPSILARADAFSRFKRAKRVLLADMENEEVSSVSLSVAGIDKLLAHAQEHISSISRIPLVKSTGISPSGLNASSEGEIRVYYDLVHAEQEYLLRVPVQYFVDLVQIVLFGDVDSDITHGKPKGGVVDRLLAERRGAQGASQEAKDAEGLQNLVAWSIASWRSALWRGTRFMTPARKTTSSAWRSTPSRASGWRT
jgi:Protein of unknown function (DUF1073)